MKNKKDEFRERILFLIQERKYEREKISELFKPRYDDIYFKGMEWLDSL